MLFRVSLSKPQVQEKHMANSLYLCMYVSVYVAIRVHHIGAQAQCESALHQRNRVATLNNTHQRNQAWPREEIAIVDRGKQKL